LELNRANLKSPHRGSTDDEMKMTKLDYLSAFAGLIFALGLGLGGMTRADVVLGFLDVTGDWNPSLIFVMAGAVLFNFVTFRLILNRPTPFWRSKFQVPTNNQIDKRLIIGSAIFGIGWGLAGVCPGPGIVAFSSLSLPAVVYIVGLFAGVWLFRGWDARSQRNQG